MFSSIGRRIRRLARLICYIGLLASVIWMVAVWFTPRYPSPGGFVIFLSGLATGIGAALGTLVLAYTTYGFGRLVDDTSAIRAMLEHPIEPEPEAEPEASAGEDGQ